MITWTVVVLTMRGGSSAEIGRGEIEIGGEAVEIVGPVGEQDVADFVLFFSVEV